MKSKFLLSIVFLTIVLSTQAQNGSPYYSLSGNSNAAATSKLGTTNAVPLNLITNNVSRLYIGTDGKLGFGTTAPANQFHVEGNGLNLFVNPAAVSATSGSGLVGYVRGTPTAAGQRLGYFLTGSLNAGVDPGNGTGMVGYADGAWSTQSRPSYLTFETTKSGSRDRAEAMRVASNGYVGIGTATPSHRLQVVDSTVAVFAVGQGPDSYGISASGGIGTYSSGTNYGSYSTGTNTGVYGAGYSYGIWGVGTVDGVYAVGTVGVEAVSTADFGDAINGRGSGSQGYGGNFSSSSSLGVYATTGATNSYAGYFQGKVYCSGTYVGSDKRLKKNIAEFSDAVSIISKLKPRTYEYQTDGKMAEMNLPQGKHYGLIAQDLETVLPNLVNETPQYPRHDTTSGANRRTASSESKQTFKAVNYTELIPILIKGMQEQNEKMQQMQEEIQELKALLSNNTNGSLSSVTLDVASPNPAKSSTTIRYGVPAGTASAKLIVVNMSGQVLKEFNLAGGGGQINLNVSNLASGTYPCTLWMNGQPAISKQLVVAH